MVYSFLNLHKQSHSTSVYLLIKNNVRNNEYNNCIATPYLAAQNSRKTKFKCTRICQAGTIGCPCNSRKAKPPPPPPPLPVVTSYYVTDMAAAQSLEDVFRAFSKFGDTRSDGTAITLTQSDKWMKQATIIDGKRITTTDTGIAFNKFKSKSLQYADFVKFVEDLANGKKMDPGTLKGKLVACGPPGTNQATQAVKVGGVDRLTDTSKYTGAHKQRFDESGKGKGIEGREDVNDGAGYVQGYKEKNTYDNKHK